MNPRTRSAPTTTPTYSDEARALLHGVADPVRLAILRALSEVGSATTSELGGLTATSRSTIRRHAMAMTAAGLLTEEGGTSDGATTGRPARRFGLSDTARAAVEAAFGGEDLLQR